MATKCLSHIVHRQKVPRLRPAVLFSGRDLSRSLRLCIFVLSRHVEAVLAKQPDLVVGVRETDREKIKRMERMGLRVVVISVSSLKDTFESIHFLAGIVGREEAGEKLGSQLQGQIDRIRARIAGAKRRRVLMLVGQRPMVAVGKGTFIDELLTLAGGENIAGAAPQPWPHLPMDYVVARPPTEGSQP